MKALVYEAPEVVALRDVPEPAPGPGEVLVEVAACGLCGSDMHAFLGHDERRPAPLVLGHEAAGVVAGDGRRVAVNPLVTCMACDDCRSGRTNLCRDRQILSMPPRPGAFAERVAVPERNLVEVPAHFPLRRAALAEPLACGWHAMRLAERTSPRPLGACRALVLGGGAIGLAAALALHAQGVPAVTIVEPNPARHAALAGAGRFQVVAEAGAEEHDVVVDAYGGAATRAAATTRAAPGGVLVHVGLASGQGGFDARRMTLQELTVVGSYAYTAADFGETFAAMVDGRLGPLDWAEARPLAAGAGAFRDAHAGRLVQPKLILEP